MKRDENIDHEGVIVDINTEFITVEILSSSACGSCAANGACSLGEVETKVVEVANSGYSNFSPGEKVNVLLKKSLGHKALYISYLIPLLILVAILLSLSSAGAGDLLTGLAILGGLAIYYTVVYLFRDRFRKEYIFTIEKLN
jgi:sigma-E factor negative regulatory protein RseC